MNSGIKSNVRFTYMRSTLNHWKLHCIRLDLKELLFPKSKLVLNESFLQEGWPLAGPKTGLLSNTQKWIVWGVRCADKARSFIGKGHLVESSRVREHRKTALPCGRVGFYGDGISFQVVFIQAFWEGPRVLPGGAHLIHPRWMPERRILGGGQTCSDLSWTLPVGGGLLVLCSLPGPPVVKQLMQMVTMVPDQGGWLQCASPNIWFFCGKKKKFKLALNQNFHI